VEYLQAEEKSYGLDRVISSVDEVPDHDKLGCGDSSSLLQQVFDVEELSVDISCKVDGRIY